MPSPEEATALEDLARVRARIAERLASVERIVAVMSGKGGVGKSLVAVNLAAALARDGLRVGILDADLNSPSVARMLGIRSGPVRVAADGLRPNPGPLGLQVQSLDFFLQGSEPLAWDGARGEGAPLRSWLEDAALGDLLGETVWGELDALVIDLAPGADRLPALVRLLPRLTGALAVAIPTAVSRLAVERSVRRAIDAGVPMIGLVENLGSSICDSCGAEGPLFAEASVDDLARDLALPVQARIPLDPRLAAAADAGRPFAEEAPDSPAARAFAGLAACVARFGSELREERA